MSMKRERINYLLCLLFFTVLAMITFRCVWPADYVFSASDMNFGLLAFKKNNLPESFTGFFTANQVMGGSNYSFTLFNVLLAALPVKVFANVFYGLFLVTSSISLIWFLRLWKRSWLASIFGALIGFWFNSIMLSSGGHAYKMEVLTLSVLGLCLIEKAVRAVSLKKTAGFSALAGVVVGVMMIEQPDVALLAGLFIGSYTLFRLLQRHATAFSRWGAVLVPIGVVALLLAGPSVVKSYGKNIAGASSVQGGGGEKWNYITQWSLVPSEWPDLIASGWGGWSSGNPKGPYWGKLGQSAEWDSTKQGFRNFKLTSNYIGIIPFLLGAFGLAAAIRNRKDEEGAQILFWSVVGLLGLCLAFGKYSILYKMFYHLPLVGNIRAPIKLLDNFQICLGIISAYGLDRLLADGKGGKLTKILWTLGAACGGLMLLAGLKLLVFPAGQAAEFITMGFEPFAKTMVQNMSNAWLHAALLALVATGLIFVVWKGMRRAKWVAAVFVLVLAVDSLVLTSHYFQSADISALKKGNVVTNFLKENQGNERTFFADPGGIYNQWLASDGPYHGLNLFNIWQMPRMPLEYKEFLGTVGRNQIRLWELSAIKYVAAPAGILQQLQQNPELGKQFHPVLNYQVPTAQGMRKDILLEFKGTIPRFALFSGWKTVPLDQQCNILASPSHTPATTVLIPPEAGVSAQASTQSFFPLVAEVSKKTAVMELKAEAPSMVRFAQRYQEGWTVLVDGHPADLLRVDYLCMGVLVPTGSHTVEFRCLDGTTQMLLPLGVLTFSLLSAGMLLKPEREAPMG